MFIENKTYPFVYYFDNNQITVYGNNINVAFMTYIGDNKFKSSTGMVFVYDNGIIQHDYNRMIYVNEYFSVFNNDTQSLNNRNKVVEILKDNNYNVVTEKYFHIEKMRVQYDY